MSVSLQQITIKSPCQMDWELMDGDEQVRHCEKCKKNVYNISAMTEDQAIDLISNRGEKICARIYKRPDGTVVTAKCPSKTKPIAAWKRPFRFSLAALLFLMTGCAGLAAASPWIGKKIEPLVQWLFPEEDSGVLNIGPEMGDMVMGAMELPIPPVTPGPTPGNPIGNGENGGDGA